MIVIARSLPLLQHYYFYHLWHPLDHVEAGIRVRPNLKPFLDRSAQLETLIHERYRNPKNFTLNRNYELNGWLSVADPISNALKNRMVMTMPIMGIDVSQGERVGGTCGGGGERVGGSWGWGWGGGRQRLGSLRVGEGEGRWDLGLREGRGLSGEGKGT